MISVTIPGRPVGQARGRAGAVYRKGPDGRPIPVTTREGRVIVKVHDPDDSRDWKSFAAGRIEQAMQGHALLQAPILAVVESVFPCPRGDYRKSDARPRRWSQSARDADNLAKAALDAANGIAWGDDRDVAFLVSLKLTGAQGEPPFVRLTAWELRVEPADALHYLGELARKLGEAFPTAPVRVVPHGSAPLFDFGGTR